MKTCGLASCHIKLLAPPWYLNNLHNLKCLLRTHHHLNITHYFSLENIENIRK